MNTDVLFSSNTDNWETPQDLFDELNKEFGFGVDVCASEDNAKCEMFFDVNDNGLVQEWGGHGTVWCNPPYGRKIGDWVKKAYETAEHGHKVVMLIPARTDTKWFHDYIYKKPNTEIRFVKGRLKFGRAKNSAPFPSIIVVFNGNMEDKNETKNS